MVSRGVSYFGMTVYSLGKNIQFFDTPVIRIFRRKSAWTIPTTRVCSFLMISSCNSCPANLFSLTWRQSKSFHEKDECVLFSADESCERFNSSPNLLAREKKIQIESGTEFVQSKSILSCHVHWTRTGRKYQHKRNGPRLHKLQYENRGVSYLQGHN